MLTVSEDEDDLFAAIKAGRPGLPAQEPRGAAAPHRCSRRVGRGEAAITPATAARIIDEFLARRRGGGQQASAAADRARARGAPAGHRRAAQQGDRRASSGISENTVKFHLKNIVEKLHAQSRAELAARAVREGLVPDCRATGLDPSVPSRAGRARVRRIADGAAVRRTVAAYPVG